MYTRLKSSGPCHTSGWLGFKPTTGNNNKRWNLTKQSRSKKAMVAAGAFNPFLLLPHYHFVRDHVYNNMKRNFWNKPSTKNLIKQYFNASVNTATKKAALNLLWKTYPGGVNRMTGRNKLTRVAFERKIWEKEKPRETRRVKVFPKPNSINASNTRRNPNNSKPNSSNASNTRRNPNNSKPNSSRGSLMGSARV